MKNIYFDLFYLLDKNRNPSLATIIKTEGSSPQVPGASALFSNKKLVSGTLGGGLLEAEAHKKAIEARKNRKSLLWEFKLEDDMNSEDGAICGGKIKILIEACPENNIEIFRKVFQALRQRKSGILTAFINIISKEKVTVSRSWLEGVDESLPFIGKTPADLGKEIAERLSERKPCLYKLDEKMLNVRAKEGWLFLEPISPFPQLYIIGAGHIGQVVSRLASMLSFEVTVIDDRPEFANKQRLPDADHIIADDIKKTLKGLSDSSDRYYVIVSRGHQHDANALREIINSRAAYIGMIGSKRKVRLMREEFLKQGWATAHQFDSVYTPIGIDINSKTVEEIGISIAAQLVQVRSEVVKKAKRSG